MVHWDADGRKDLLVGRSDGMVQIFLNVGTDEDPEFDGGTFLEVGLPGSKTSIDVGSRATSIAIDWKSDNIADVTFLYDFEVSSPKKGTALGRGRAHLTMDLSRTSGLIVREDGEVIGNN